jgi:hypothetical protein
LRFLQFMGGSFKSLDFVLGKKVQAEML